MKPKDLFDDEKMRLKDNIWVKEEGTVSTWYIHRPTGTMISPPETKDDDGNLMGTKNKPFAVVTCKTFTDDTEAYDPSYLKTYTFKTRPEASSFFNKYKEKIIKEEEKNAEKIIARLIKTGEYRRYI